MQASDGGSRGLKGPSSPALANVLKRHCEFPVYNAYRGQGDLASLHLGFQEIANPDARSPTTRGRQSNLEFGFDFDKRWV